MKKIIMRVFEKNKDIKTKTKVVFPVNLEKLNYEFMYDYSFEVIEVGNNFISVMFSYLGFEKAKLIIKKGKSACIEQVYENYKIKVKIKLV